MTNSWIVLTRNVNSSDKMAWLEVSFHKTRREAEVAATNEYFSDMSLLVMIGRETSLSNTWDEDLKGSCRARGVV